MTQRFVALYARTMSSDAQPTVVPRRVDPSSLAVRSLLDAAGGLPSRSVSIVSIIGILSVGVSASVLVWRDTSVFVLTVASITFATAWAVLNYRTTTRFAHILSRATLVLLEADEPVDERVFTAVVTTLSDLGASRYVERLSMMYASRGMRLRHRDEPLSDVPQVSIPFDEDDEASPQPRQYRPGQSG